MRKLLALLLIAGAPVALAQNDVRYVTDELQIVLRDSPRADGAPRAVVNTGMRLTVIDGKGADGYVKVRTAENAEGWILERHLKKVPVAREQTVRLEKELAASQAQLKKVQDDYAKLTADVQRLSGGEPIASRELMAQADSLKQQLKDKDREVAAMRERYDVARASQRTLALGGGLVAGGALLALLLRLVWPKSRRWGGDF